MEMGPVPVLPLARHPFLRTRDVDEAQEFFGRINTPVETYTHGRAPYAWHSNHLVVGPLGIASNWWSDDGGAISHEVQDIFSLDFVLGSTRGETDHRGVTVSHVGGETAVILSPGAPAIARIQAGFHVLEVVIRRVDLEAALGALVGPACRPPLEFAPLLRFNSGVGRSLFGLVEYLAAQVDRDDTLLESPLVVAGLADSLMFGMLERLEHNHSGLLTRRVAGVEPRYVRRAADYLDAHAAQPIRLADVAAAVGVGVRALQLGFRRYRGCSPIAFLRELRLRLARVRLLADPQRAITAIAIDCGFAHLGRFSAMYRARFGETPSQTRARIA
nr:AraC family transcriptional regulator [Kofleriaceae bacterium]